MYCTYLISSKKSSLAIIPSIVSKYNDFNLEVSPKKRNGNKFKCPALF